MVFKGVLALEGAVVDAFAREDSPELSIVEKLFLLYPSSSCNLSE